MIGDGVVPLTQSCPDKGQTNKLTNADRIRAMTDEELADWLEPRTCQWGWLAWLKQEVDDEMF